MTLNKIMLVIKPHGWPKTIQGACNNDDEYIPCHPLMVSQLPTLNPLYIMLK